MIRSKKISWIWHGALLGSVLNAYKIVVRKPGVKRPLTRPRRRSEDNINMIVERNGAWTESMWLTIGTNDKL
jgi:hypothetical protein